MGFARNKWAIFKVYISCIWWRRNCSVFYM